MRVGPGQIGDPGDARDLVGCPSRDVEEHDVGIVLGDERRPLGRPSWCMSAAAPVVTPSQRNGSATVTVSSSDARVLGRQLLRESGAFTVGDDEDVEHRVVRRNLGRGTGGLVDSREVGVHVARDSRH